MSRRPDWIPPRKAIPAATIRAVLERSDGVCEAEGCKKPGKEYDHITPQALGGDNSAENIQLLCRKCHVAKTKTDAATVTKADRQGGRLGPFARRKKAQAAGKHKAIKSAAFQTNKDAPFKRTLASKNRPGRTVRREGV